jgi:hypothetical protein
VNPTALIHPKDIRLTKKIYVEWIDSNTIIGWTFGKNLTDEFAEAGKICSIGYLVKDTKEFITITTSISINGSVMDPLTIPKCAILKRKTLK